MITSIIIPTYREVDLIIQLSNRLSCLDRSDIEVIICDALPISDHFRLLCNSYGFRYVACSVASRAIQMNLGAAAAKGNTLVFLHADVLPPLNFAERIRKAIADGNEFGFFAYHFSPTNRWLDINAKFTHKDGFFAGGGDQIHFMTKAFYKSMSGYNENYCIMEDFEFTSRVKKSKIKPFIIKDEATVSSRKYLKNSYLRVNVVNLWAVILFYFGAKPERIKLFYAKAIK